MSEGTSSKWEGKWKEWIQAALTKSARERGHEGQVRSQVLICFKVGEMSLCLNAKSNDTLEKG